MTIPVADIDTFRLESKGGLKLVLRPPLVSDAPNMQARVADRRNVEYLPHLQSKGDQPVSAVESWIAMMRRDFGTKNIFLLLELDGEVVGEGGLGFIDLVNRTAEAGVMLSWQQAGRGIATESVRLSIDYAFSQLKLDSVRFGTMADNAGMRAVLERKLGLTGKSNTRKDGLEEVLYSVDRQDWIAKAI